MASGVSIESWSCYQLCNIKVSFKSSQLTEVLLVLVGQLQIIHQLSLEMPASCGRQVKLRLLSKKKVKEVRNEEMLKY